MQILGYILIGIVGGLLGGSFGIGGGSFMVPVFVLLLGLSQHEAQGTSLAVMAFGILILPTLRYYWAGNVNVQLALFVAVGFIVGSILGAHFVQGMPDATLKKAFGVYLIVVGIKMTFFH